MSTMPIIFSTNSFEWSTPQAFFDKLNEEFGFTFDPCATAENAKCQYFFTQSQDGLEQDWNNEVIFMNPPYGKTIKLWMQKAFSESKRNCTVVCLVPSRTGAAWWHDYAMKGEIRFIRGRLKFNDSKQPAPFASAVIIFRAFHD